VPSVVASRVVETATIALFCSAACQRSEVKNSSYQRSDKPGIG